MDFRVSDDQRELAEGIRAMLAGRLPLEHLRAREGHERAIGAEDWAALGETGVFSLTLPAPSGTGLGLADATVVFEELGRGLVPGPLVGTFLAGRAGVVEGAAEGRVQVGVHTTGRPGPVLVEHLGSLDALLVLDGDGPGQLLTPAPVGGAQHVGHPLDPLTPLWRLDALPFGGSAADVHGRLWHEGALLSAALQVGHAAAALDLAVAYAKERSQFGKPIGSFQAVKHMLADALVDVEGMRSTVYYAAWCAAAGDAERSLAASMAKAWCSDASRRVMAAGLQVHGGIGFTWEHEMHLYLKRAQLDQVSYGDAAAHRDRVATLLRTRLEAGEALS
jgi:alkylation response protein AidB-like acyl-CoA dehydrogenase